MAKSFRHRRRLHRLPRHRRGIHPHVPRLTWQQILASLTTNPAARFGSSTSSGHIAKGLDADLVVLSADPAQDVTAFFKVAFTIRHGKILFGKP